MVIFDFFRFLINPVYESKKIKINVKIFGFLLLFLSSEIITYSLIFLLKVIIDLPHNKIRELSTSSIFLYAILLAPLYEELTFRLGLFYTKLNFSISFSLILTYLIIIIIDIKLLSIIGLTSFSIFFIIIYYFLGKYEKVSIRINQFWIEYFRLVFYLSAILFGIIHIHNWEIETISSALLIPILILPQITGGLFLGFVRIKLGFAWAVMFHIFNNLIPTLIIYF